MADQRRYFIPAWVLEDKDLSSGDKLVLCILSTRSAPIPGTLDRASYRVGPGEIADLLGYSYLQVTKILKKLEGKLIKKIEGGYMLLSPDSNSLEGVAVNDEEPPAPAKETAAQAPTTVEPLAQQAPAAYQPRNLLTGCYTWEECVERLSGKSICVADLAHSYDCVLDSAPFKSSLFKYLQACRARIEKSGGSDTTLFVAEKRKS